MNEILEKIEKATHIVLISHVNPDADSLGSASAMYTFLLQKHKKVSWFCKSEQINQKLSFLPWFEKIKSTFPLSGDLAISLDCANEKRLGVQVECDLINIDHHISNTNYGNLNFVQPDFISTTAVLYNFFKASSAKINIKIATALYAGILDDSDAFLSQNVDGTTFATVSELIELGAEHQLCNKKVLKSVSLASLRLKSVMFKNMTLEQDAKVAVFCVSEEEMRATGALGVDCEAPLKESLHLPNVKVALLLRQKKNFTIKGSLRSNFGVDVSKIATRFGGGGHVYRAGFEIDEIISLEEVKIKILDLLEKEL
ncbi:bifunctional oligoribonuclease/PAP phosphatase NrnA [Sulfurimonas sp.]|uniref:DHH family phosphoesterase n=1 Tax=Sulfurimonas sp. TaxID=2022749 RepID=UPI0025EA31F4|nr:bifunctional oligoribonuclease/PAP phosphatase NrnA [Sulfurimonas sp.]MCK9473314.1 bifunctional oligoribonuclease/PAP phosphatase NrnA [Sulfurimonas sp.]